MNLTIIVAIALGLAVDAFAVSVAAGVAYNELEDPGMTPTFAMMSSFNFVKMLAQKLSL